MKHLFTLKTIMLACLLFVGMGAWATDVVYKTATLTGSSFSANSNSYTGSFSSTTDGFTVDLVNFNNNNKGWEYVKTGNKSNASVGTITTNAAIDKAVTKVVVTIDAVTASNVNSITLYSGSSANACTTSEGTFSAATGAQTVSISSPAANKFYKISFDCKKGSSNGLVTVSKVQYYVSDGGAEPTKYTVNVANIIANGTVTANPTSAAEGAEVTLTATPSTGYMFGSWNVTNASTSAAITVTDNKFTMPAANVNVSATFTAIQEKTIAEFIASEGGKCYLTGTVSNIVNSTYGNFDLTDESGTIYVYGCLTPGGEPRQFASLNVVAGDKIKILADEYELYNEKHEAKNVTFVEEIAIPKTKYTVTIETPENGTLVVKDGETVLASGDQVEEGNNITIECTPANADYRYKNWQYKEDGNWVTMTSTMTRTITQNISIRANFELVPVYTVSWSVNGSTVKSEDLKEGADVTAPDVVAPAGKVFLGWATSPIDGTTNVAPQLVTPNATATAAATYYAVFATQTGSGEITYTKLTSNSFEEDVDYVIAAEESSEVKTLHYFSSYTGTTANESWGVTSTDADDAIIFSLSGTANALVAQDESSNYLQALATGKFRMSSSSTTLKLNNDGRIYNPAQDSQWNMRYNHNNGSGGFRWYSTSTGCSAYFYKKEVDATYSDYCTTVPAPVANTIDFYAAGEDGYYTTFSNDKAVTIPDMIEVDDEVAQFYVYTVWADGNELVFVDLDENDGLYYLSENEGYLIKAEFSGDVAYTGEKAFSVEYTELDYDLNSNDAENVLRPASEAKTGDNKYYMLAYSDSNCTPASLGFYWGAAEGAAFESRANSAYLALPKATTPVKGFRFNGNTTGIKTVNTEATANKAVKRIVNGQLIIEKAGKMFNAAGAEMK